MIEDCRRCRMMKTVEDKFLENVKKFSTLNLQKKYLMVLLGSRELIRIISVAVPVIVELGKVISTQHADSGVSPIIPICLLIFCSLHLP